MFEFGLYEWSIAALSAFLMGVSKTGLPGAGILSIPLMAMVLPARESVGVVLPLLIFGDIAAVGYYHHRVSWPVLAPLLPWTLAGVVAGAMAFNHITDAQLRPGIGCVVLALLALHLWRNRKSVDDLPVPGGFFAALMGFLAGATTMLANAAGPVMTIYLLAMRLPRDKFVATGAWFFFLVNVVKVPFSVGVGAMAAHTLLLNLVLLPALIVGTIGGILLLPRIPNKGFNALMQILAALAAVRLLW
jgi:hypothetical protein